MPRCEAIAITTGKRCRLMGSTLDRMVDTPAPDRGSGVLCLCSVHAKKLEQDQANTQQVSKPIQLVERPKPVGMCSICLEDIQPKQETEVDTCKHIFHRTCMVKWLEKNNITCPYCRHVLDEGEFMTTYLGRMSRLSEKNKYMCKVHYLMGLLKQSMKEVNMNPATAIDESRMISMFRVAALLTPLGGRMQSLMGFETLVYTFVASVTPLPSVSEEEPAVTV